MIDVIAAIDSVVEATTAVDGRRRRGESAGPDSVAAAALSLAVPAGRRPEAAAALLEQLRADATETARACDCTLGAVLVWRAVDRAERAGEPALAAAEAGVRTALAYLEIASTDVFETLGVDDPQRCAALAVLELQARLALSHPMEESA